MSKKVLRVDSVDMRIIRSELTTLTIVARGVVPSTGYRNGRLVPHICVQFPSDGIYNFEFVADGPNTVSNQFPLPILGTFIWHDLPKELKGIRVHASLNSVEHSLSSATELKLEPLPFDSDAKKYKHSVESIQHGQPECDSNKPEQKLTYEAIECPACKGAGSVLLLTSSSLCEKCRGTGMLPIYKTEANDLSPESNFKSTGESTHETLMVTTYTQYIEDANGNVVGVKETSREEKMIPASNAGI